MSRFNLSFLLIAFACLFTVACEKEEIVLSTPAATDVQYSPAAAKPFAQSPTLRPEITPSPDPIISSIEAMLGQRANLNAAPTAQGHAADLLAKLSVAPIIGSGNVAMEVFERAPEHPELNYLDMLSTPNQSASDRSVETATIEINCPFGDCATTIPEMVARYQEIATQQCQDQFLCITCCYEGDATYVVIYVEAICMPAAVR